MSELYITHPTDFLLLFESKEKIIECYNCGKEGNKECYDTCMNYAGPGIYRPYQFWSNKLKTKVTHTKPNDIFLLIQKEKHIGKLDGVEFEIVFGLFADKAGWLFNEDDIRPFTAQDCNDG